MKQIFIQIVSFTLAFLVLFSTFSFTVEKHYCGGLLLDVSFIGETKGCNINMDLVASTKKNNCCKDVFHKVEGQDELQSNKIEKIIFEKEQFLLAFAFSYKYLFVRNELKDISYAYFHPPDIWQDYQVLHQVFLI
jgi:hypothetical protein